MNTDRERKRIVKQLKELQAEQDILLARLASLALSDEEEEEEQEVPSPNRAFSVGDRVRVKNPKKLQPKEGIVSSIGVRFVTVKASNGSQVLREPKNLEHYE